MNATGPVALGSIVVAAFVGAWGLQPEAAPPAAPAQPEPAVMAEAPDGTKMTVLNTTEIKMIIEDLKIGEGSACTGRSTITIHYHGTLMDGTMFDSTRGKEPATFPLPRLISGWQAGLPGMKVGGIRRLTIPYQMAYGEAGSPPTIPAKADLVFSIELVGVQ